MSAGGICIVSSCGGHLAEIRLLRPVYARYDHFYVLNDRAVLAADMVGRTYFIRHSERDLLFFVNLWEAWWILRRQRPRMILSTGAGPLVPFALVGRLLGIPTVFVEISTQVTRPSLTGRIMARLAHSCFYQWPALSGYFRRGTYGGVLQWSS